MKRKGLNILFGIIIVFYVVMMMDLFFRFNVLHAGGDTISRDYNFIPFRTILNYLTSMAHMSKSRVMSNVLGNIIIFVPYGTYLQMLRKEMPVWKGAVLTAATSVCIEAVQLAFGIGACDIDDVILNFLGGLIGILGYRALRYLIKEARRADTVVMAASLLIGAPLACVYIMITIRRHFG